MYLKNIEVQGFKSFAHKINFEFHNGITGIVGPNGSGKSNVADAVRWVLGEQSAKQLRGGNMQDVIFSGTQNRKPLGYASVAITLDNSDHQITSEYEEITVTRRLYRSGESEYLINGAACRLKDINEMFYDTGIGKEGYSIIGQGQIDQILSGKPEDRRELFDEAAGIVKFKRRKQISLKKLEQEKQNLVRVSDIISELTIQLAPLEKQADTAKEYLAQKEELKKSEITMFCMELENHEAQLSQLEGKAKIADDELLTATEESQRLKTEYEKVEAELEALTQQIDSVRETSQTSALQKQQLENQIQVLKEQIKSNAVNDEHFQNRMDTVRAELAKRVEASDELKNRQILLQEAADEILRKQMQKENALSDLKEQMALCHTQIEDAKNEIIETLNNRATIKGKVQRFAALKEQLEIRRAEISQRAISLKQTEASQQKAMQDTTARLAEITSRIELLTTENTQLEAQLSEIQSSIKKETEQMDIGQTAYHREASRLESLRNITERYDGYGNSIRKVMEQKSKYPQIKGVVADLFQVQKDYETAVETALGAGIQNIVTTDEATAKELIQFLKTNKYGRATFLPLTAIGSRGAFDNKAALAEPGVIGIASDLVQVKEEYKALAKYLLGRTLVISDIDAAITIARKYRYSFRMVTLEGDSLNPGGSMTGGAYRNSSNLLGRRREIKDLEFSVNELKKDMELKQSQIDEKRSCRNTLRDTISKNHETLQSCYIEQNTEKLNLNQIEEKHTEFLSKEESLRQENLQLQSQKQTLEQDTNSISAELTESEVSEKEIEQLIVQKQEEYDRIQTEVQELSTVLESIHMESSTQQQKKRFAEENLLRITEEMDGFQREADTIQQQLLQNSTDIEKKQTDILTIQEAVTAITESITGQEHQLTGLLTQKDTLTAHQKRFFEERDALSAKITLLDKESFRLHSQMEKLVQSQEGLINYMWEEYEITPKHASTLRMEDVTDRTKLKERINEIKNAIRKLGDVNVNAIEDYKNVAERHEFLTTQYNDLVASEETLLGIIRELDEGMRRQFAEKFKEIQIQFDKVFKELFGGGQGTLELLEDEDILEAGIRIISQPPGKKLQNMMQLSGGEKALTAIALLFAIQNLKPSPFCLLDEIEAALDDSNVVRFARYLQKLTKNTQFIVITHRRGTMNHADRLYGITMQEKGVSTLVSVNLVEDELTK
ncbi:MAG: chromosome segregation protein SMC [Lachnospiraceae bacterium]